MATNLEFVVYLFLKLGRSFRLYMYELWIQTLYLSVGCNYQKACYLLKKNNLIYCALERYLSIRFRIVKLERCALFRKIFKLLPHKTLTFLSNLNMFLCLKKVRFWRESVNSLVIFSSAQLFRHNLNHMCKKKKQW